MFYNIKYNSYPFIDNREYKYNTHIHYARFVYSYSIST